MESPVFVCNLDIAKFDGPDTDSEHEGRMTIRGLRGEPLKGYRCHSITAYHQWSSNGKCKGFECELVCKFDGSMPQFNHLMRIMNNREAEYIILLPRKDKSYIVIGSGTCDIELVNHTTEHQAFILGVCYNHVPIAYYDGDLDITDCTEKELLQMIY